MIGEDPKVAAFLPEGQEGVYRVERFTVPEGDIHAVALGFKGRGIRPGTYTSLMRGETLVMSDTPAEWRDHAPFVYQAHGRVLVAGLGIGMVVNALLKRPAVTHVTVVEIAHEVINLVGPHLKALHGDKLTLVQGNILTWQPPRGETWDCGWYDIWDNITPDNLGEMKKLHRRFGSKVGRQASWARAQCERRERDERNYFKGFRL